MVQKLQLIPSRPYFSLLNASMVLHLHIYQHFPIAQHEVYALLIIYFLNNPLPELKLANDRSPVQLQGHGTNYPLQCANVRVLTRLHSRHIFSQIIILTVDDRN